MQTQLHLSLIPDLPSFNKTSIKNKGTGMSDSQFCYAHWRDVDLLCSMDDPHLEPFPPEFRLCKFSGV